MMHHMSHLISNHWRKIIYYLIKHDNNIRRIFKEVYQCFTSVKTSFCQQMCNKLFFQELQEIIEYEERFGGIVLDPSSSPNEPQNGPNVSASSTNSTNKDTFYFSVKNPHACSPHYISVYYKKAHLIIRMLEFRIGQELMMQVCTLVSVWNIEFRIIQLWNSSIIR